MATARLAKVRPSVSPWPQRTLVFLILLQAKKRTSKRNGNVISWSNHETTSIQLNQKESKSMKTRLIHRRRACGVWPVCLLTVILATLSLPAFANEGVVPSHANFRGMSYGEWSAEWWKWCFSLPADGHPLFNGTDCSAGQSGNVWFLGGTFTLIEGEDGSVVGVAERDCTIPPGTALFFPILNTECATIEGNGETEEELRECVTLFGSSVEHPDSNLECTIDGNPVGNLTRVQSPAFTYGPLPEGNILQALGLDVPAGTTSLSVGDGVYVMVAPLSVGSHTIHFAGSGIFTQEEHGFDFVFHLDITYYITVQP